MSRVPHLGRRGRQQDLTSLTGSSEFLALGTSCGSVYWYSRREDSLQRLDCWLDTPVTCLALVETTDLMLAVGSGRGDLTIFQIPKPVLTDIGVPFPGTIQNIQEFSIRNVHTTDSSISALCWAANGERLFSGDTAGRLAMSVVDFFKNTVQSSLVSVETSEILALSYLHRTLLVSSAGETAVLEVSQSGEERRVRLEVRPGERTRGSCLLEAGVGRPGLRCVVVRQPGHCLTLTDTAGTSLTSLSLAEELERQHLEIPLVNPLSIAREGEDCQWDNVKVLSAQDQTVLVWSKVSLHLVSLSTGSVLASCRALRNILDLAVTSSGEILVLETGRSVVRLGRSEDSLGPRISDWRRGSTVAQAADTHLESALNSVGSNLVSNIPRFPLLNSLAGSLSSEFRSLKEKLKERRSSSSPVEEVMEAIIGLDYTKSTSEVSPELSPTEVRNLLDPEFKTRMDRIGEAEFTVDIAQQRSPRRCKKKVRSIREINEDSENQEREESSSDNSGETETDTITSSDKAGGVSDEVTAEEREQALMKMLRIQEEEEEELVEEVMKSREEPVDSETVSGRDIYNNETSLASIGYGPPSDSVEHRSLQSLGREEPDLAGGERETSVPGVEERVMESQGRAETDGWLSYEMPGPAVSVSETRDGLVICDNRDNVFTSSLSQTPGSCLTWRRAQYQASDVRSSRSEQTEIVWRLHNHTAFCLLPGCDENTWQEIGRNVASLELSQTSGWLVKLDGGLVLHQDLSSSSPFSTQPRQIYTGHFIKEVRQWEDFLVARTTNSDLLLARLEMLSEEEAWRPLVCGGESGGQVSVVGFDISQAGEVWVVGRDTRTGASQFLLSSDWSGPSPSWSVLVSPHLLSPPSNLAPPLSRPIILPTGSRLWATSGVSTSLLSHSHPVSTFLWSRLDISSLVCSSLQSGQARIHGGGKEAYCGQLLLQTETSLLQLDITRKTLVAVPSLPPGEQVGQVSVVPGHMWVLTESGNIYCLQQGNRWRRLRTDQLDTENRRLVSLSLSDQPGQVWAVEETGQVYLRLGSLDLPPDHAMPVWVGLDREQEVEDELGEEGRLVEVVCSSGGHMVWARDNRQGVWARAGLYPDLPQGTGWLAVTGLAVRRLAISRSSVWALAEDGRVYRRTGLSHTDWLGDTWQPVSGCQHSALDLTVGQSDSVWSLDQAGIIRQLELRETENLLASDTDGTEDTDWTIIQ